MLAQDVPETDLDVALALYSVDLLVELHEEVEVEGCAPGCGPHAIALETTHVSESANAR